MAVEVFLNKICRHVREVLQSYFLKRWLQRIMSKAHLAEQIFAASLFFSRPLCPEMLVGAPWKCHR